VTRQVTVEGFGLHSGASARVALELCAGKVRLARGTAEASIDELEVASTARATTVVGCGGALRVQTVEHLMAAFAGLGVRDGVRVAIDGPEVPLVDGGAARWCDALRSIGVAPGGPRQRVATATTLEWGSSRYEFTPSSGVEIQVVYETDDSRILAEAGWLGDPDDFRRRIAPARTFALAGDVEELLRGGLARHVDPTAVVVIAPEAIHHAGQPFSADEPARHKLLDLLGDLYLLGGPPLGRIRALRPGHAANVGAFRQARARGVLVQSG
jgi:UDP-3-O-[3-hydroxymyristoyl] N-acetylglucosamine deacetylase